MPERRTTTPAPRGAFAGLAVIVLAALLVVVLVRPEGEQQAGERAAGPALTDDSAPSDQEPPAPIEPPAAASEPIPLAEEAGPPPSTPDEHTWTPWARVDLDSLSYVEVTVVDGTGRPIEGVLVIDERFPDFEKRTDENGQVTLAQDGGTHMPLRLSHPDYQPDELTVELPEKLGAVMRRQVTLLPGLGVTLRVVDAGGLPIEGARVRLLQVDGHWLERYGGFLRPDDARRARRFDPSPAVRAAVMRDSDQQLRGRGLEVHTARTGKDGRCRLASVRAGPAELFVVAEDRAAVDGGSVEIGPGATDLGTITLRALQAVEGLVVGPDGPLEGASAQALIDDVAYAATTDAEGRFALPVPEGTSSMPLFGAHADGFDAWVATDARVDAGPFVIELVPRHVAVLRLLDVATGEAVGDKISLWNVATPPSPLGTVLLMDVDYRTGGTMTADILPPQLSRGILLVAPGYRPAWIPRDELLLAAAAPRPVLLKRQSAVLVVPVDRDSLEPLDRAFLSLTGDADAGGSAVGGRDRRPVEFDEQAGGYRLDDDQIHLGPFADGTRSVMLTVERDGYVTPAPIEIVRDGRIVAPRRLEVRLEPAPAGG